MLRAALLASAETGLNRVLRMDSTALPRLGRLAGKVIEVRCSAPTLSLFILADEQGLRLASDWAAEPDCRLTAPASRLLQLAVSRNKTAVLHADDVTLEGDTHALTSLADVLQDLDLDWEYSLSQWLGPVGAQLVGSSLRGQARWTRNSIETLHRDLADYLAEESRSLVGKAEAEARFAELDDLKLRLDRLEARHRRLAHPLTANDAEE
ncbi:SCP2 domain-containing protein [Stutzerimonas nosocomialis]|uniref:Ubiquinone biosynthesis accessory factor UbiJ n=1 Tax=Stutzerimonas nosocomialis TaxID=1056496 RepID=A0A5R9QG86_9GAMM|nr:SCP2 sterol-binding domain-containing protein [Stutzerimonas nosocomialis]TLX64151.1 SCP2 domain-containing protein [Stutzerimonas nosocomialis]